MKGCRPLTDDEIQSIKTYFIESIGDELLDPHDLLTRNKTLFFVSLYLGSRISETLSIDLEDVLKFDAIRTSVYLKRRNTKGKKEGRVLTVNAPCRNLLREYIDHYGLDKDKLKSPLFRSNRGTRMSSRMAMYIFEDIFKQVGLDGKVGTHSTRKTFAKEVFDQLGGDLLGLKTCLGHNQISSTMSYINPRSEKIQASLENLRF